MSAFKKATSEAFWVGVALKDQTALIAAVGAPGNLGPLRTFEEMLKGTGADGSRAHSAGNSCPAP